MSFATPADLTWTEGAIHIATRTQLKTDGWQLVAGQYPGGSDDELCPLNVVDPRVARDDSPDPRRHSLGKLVPDVVALKDSTLMIVEAKVRYSEEDRLKLLELVGARRADLYRALRAFGSERGVPALLDPSRLALLPALAFRGPVPPGTQLEGFALVQPTALTTAKVDIPDLEAT